MKISFQLLPLLNPTRLRGRKGTSTNLIPATHSESIFNFLFYAFKRKETDYLLFDPGAKIAPISSHYRRRKQEGVIVWWETTRALKRRDGSAIMSQSRGAKIGRSIVNVQGIQWFSFRRNELISSLPENQLFAAAFFCSSTFHCILRPRQMVRIACLTE